MSFEVEYITVGPAQSLVFPTFVTAGDSQLMAIYWSIRSYPAHVLFFDHSVVEVEYPFALMRWIELTEPGYEKCQEWFHRQKHKYHNK